jgi:hypothetical protein
MQAEDQRQESPSFVAWCLDCVEYGHGGASGGGRGLEQVLNKSAEVEKFNSVTWTRYSPSGRRQPLLYFAFASFPAFRFYRFIGC